MAESTPIPESSETLRGYHHYDVPRKEMHYLKKPTGYVSGMAEGNVGYQMAWSAKVLEEKLAEEGKYCILQLNTDVEAGTHDWRDPNSWRLYANGLEVASGTGKYAKECFYASETAFLELCREAIESSNVPKIDEREYRLLKIAKRMASLEPYDDGSCTLGAKRGRVF